MYKFESLIMYACALEKFLDVMSTVYESIEDIDAYSGVRPEPSEENTEKLEEMTHDASVAADALHDILSIFQTLDIVKEEPDGGT